MSSEATTFLVDVSHSMVAGGHVDKALAYLEYTLFQKVKKGRKTDYVSCILVNCPLTKNNQDTDYIYEALEITAPVTSVTTVKLLKDIRTVLQYIETTDKDHSECLSMIQSVLVSSVMLRDFFKKRKITKNLVVFTDDMDGLDCDDDELQIMSNELDCRIILVHCEDEKKLKDNGDTIWGKCVRSVPGSVKYTILELLRTITIPKPPVVKPVRIFQGELRLGASMEDAGSSMDDFKSICIQVEGFPATKAVSNLNRKVVVKNGENDYSPVKSIIEYEIHNRVNGETYEFDAVAVSKSSIAKAYRYGSDYVVLPPTLESERIYETEPGLDIRGFLDRKDFPRYYLNSESTFIVTDTRQGSRADYMALSALVDSLIKLEKFAIARYVQRKNSEVQMCLLCPILIDDTDGMKRKLGREEQHTRALILSRLPFAEDERSSDFPKLSYQRTTSGRTLVEDTTDLDSQMSIFIDSMDLDDNTGSSESSWYRNPCFVTADPTNALSTTIPLPAIEQDGTERKANVNPLSIPAISVHRQQQALLEYMHQRYVMETKKDEKFEFQVPSMPDLLLSKTRPPKLPEIELSNRLVEMLDIKLNENRKRFARDEELVREDGSEAVGNIPTLDSLLVQGGR